MASNVVGTAYVRLRLLTDSVGKDIEKAVKSSDLQDVDIKVNADTLDADAQLEATGLEADKLDGKNPKITPKVDTKDARKQSSLLLDALLFLAPAVGPLAGAAAAGFGAVAAGAGVALLAVKGVTKEMKDGTQVGVQFTSGVQTLKTGLSTLEATAARGVLPGFNTTVASLDKSLPGVNRSVGILSTALGDLAGHTVVGLVSGLTTFEPLLTHITQEADAASRSFENWATGPGGAKFAVSLGKSWDQVEPVLVDLVKAAAGAFHAFAPLGGSVLVIVDAIAKFALVLESFPTPVLTAIGAALIVWRLNSRLGPVFDALSGGLQKLADTSTLAWTGLSGAATATANIAAKGGLIVALGTAAYQAGQSFARWVFGDNGVINSDKVFSGFYNAVVLSNGAIDDGVKSAIAYQTQQDGLVDKAGKAGISQDQLTTAITGTQAQVDALTATWKANGDPSEKTIKNLQILHDTFVNAYGPAADFAFQQKYAATLQPQVWGALKTTKDSVDQVATAYGLSADSVTNYAALVGISSDAIKTGAITNQQLADSVNEVSTAYNTADMAGSQFLTSLQQFSTSAGTAADRAALIGAYLKNAQGDLLGYQGAVASAYQANRSLTDSFKQENDQVKAGSLALGDTQRAAINLKTGMIDVTKAGAAPLIQSLGQMQDAAEKAAEATYQHEVNTKGAGAAAADAAKIFKTQTYDALVKDASQLGLTADQAKKLAQNYFDIPSDVATKVQSIGTDKVITVLDKIGQQLSYLTHHAWTPEVGLNDQASANIAALNQQLTDLNGRVSTVTINTINKNIAMQSAGNKHYGGMIDSSRITHRAGGGPAGMVSGPRGYDAAGLFALEHGEWVTDSRHAKQYLPLLQAISRGDVSAIPGAGRYASTATGNGGTVALDAASLQALAQLLAAMPWQLVATNGGLPLAKVVNEANQRQARRM